MALWKSETVEVSKEAKKEEFKSFYEMSPSERADKAEEYSEWVVAKEVQIDEVLSNLEAYGFITNEIATDIIGNIEKYLIGVSITGEKINKIEELEETLFGGVLEEVDPKSTLARGLNSIREATWKASGYKANLFKLNVADKKAKRLAKEANNPKTTLEDHIGKQEDTSDKEVTKKKKATKKGSS